MDHQWTQRTHRVTPPGRAVTGDGADRRGRSIRLSLRRTAGAARRPFTIDHRTPARALGDA
jgi:hypothetical protein